MARHPWWILPPAVALLGFVASAWAETEIDPAATYKVICIDYLWKRTTTRASDTEGDYSILGQAKKIEPVGLTIRDAIIDYVKKETAAGHEIKPNLDGRFVLDKAASPNPEEVRR